VPALFTRSCCFNQELSTTSSATRCHEVVAMIDSLSPEKVGLLWQGSLRRRWPLGELGEVRCHVSKTTTLFFTVATSALSAPAKLIGRTELMTQPERLRSSPQRHEPDAAFKSDTRYRRQSAQRQLGNRRQRVHKTPSQVHLQIVRRTDIFRNGCTQH
jgi:hypothetical protein